MHRSDDYRNDRHAPKPVKFSGYMLASLSMSGDWLLRRRKRHRWLIILLQLYGSAALADAPAVRPPARTAENLDFELGSGDTAPLGWQLVQEMGDGEFEAVTTEDQPKRGKYCGLLRSKGAASHSATLMQSVDAARFRGKRVRLKAWVRASSLVKISSQVQFWLRVDRLNGVGFVDEMSDRPIAAQDWTLYEIIGDVDNDAEALSFGLRLTREGAAYLDDVSLSVIPNVVVQTENPRAVTSRGLENLVAFTKLLGYVRHFHPSDEAASVNWNWVAVEGIRKVEDASNAVELKKKLEDIFLPYAPTLRLFATGKAPPLPRALLSSRSTGRISVTQWHHEGFGSFDPGSAYSSKRISATAPDGQIPSGSGDPRRPYYAELGGGLSAAVPIALWTDDRGTIPHTLPTPRKGSSPRGLPPWSARDRATRLAAVALIWNVFQHFYSYFDFLDVDWAASLKSALRKAATDIDELEFLDTLRLLTAPLHDGHIFLRHPAKPGGYRAPLTWVWLEDRLVVAHVDSSSADLHPGDVVRRIDGRPVEEVFAEAEKRLSGSTAQLVRLRALYELAEGDKGSSVQLEGESRSSKPFSVTLIRELPLRQYPMEERPPQYAELRPGVFYVDSDRFEDAEFLTRLPQLQSAKAIIFDYRGSPSGVVKNSNTLIRRLIQAPITIGQWLVPIVSTPDRTDATFKPRPNQWEPLTPHLSTKAAFLVDSRVASYLETLAGIASHYKLGRLIGETTAGMNGNINFIYLPGGYLVRFTGLKALKIDGSLFHGNGITPDVPVKRTISGVAAGRDEILERALDEMSERS